jgi:2-C-methyl-D-erythritol 4-phosphate cytidylyltransferase
MKKYVLVTAGGKGLRMGSDIPKQFLPLNGKPVLMHTLEAFRRYDSDITIILILPEEQINYWHDLCEEYSFKITHTVATGGDTRFQSVRNGLSLVSGDGLVAVHDGVRPFVSQDVIETCFSAAEKYKAVIPVIDIVETVREIDENGSKTVDRNKYKLVQTPQVFNIENLKRAYQQPYSDSFTDDASVIEALGETIHLVSGNRENIKITTRFDMEIGEAISRK